MQCKNKLTRKANPNESLKAVVMDCPSMNTEEKLLLTPENTNTEIRLKRNANKRYLGVLILDLLKR